MLESREFYQTATAFKNKIGLADSGGNLQKNEVLFGLIRIVCLKVKQKKNKKKEAFYNEILAPEK